MNIDTPIRKLGSVDIADLRETILAQEDVAWEEDQYRQDEYEVHAATDITGFGLTGHGLEVAQGSGVTLEIKFESLSIFQEALEMYEKGMTTGVNASNRSLVENHIEMSEALSLSEQEILFDPQTSGGLLGSVPENQSIEILDELQQSGVSQARIIGAVQTLGATHLKIL